MTEVYSRRLRGIADAASGRRHAVAHGVRGASRARATRRRPKSATFRRSGPMPSGCPPCPRRSWRATWAWRCSASRASPTWPPACCEALDHDEVMETAGRVAGDFIALLEGSLAGSRPRTRAGRARPRSDRGRARGGRTSMPSGPAPAMDRAARSSPPREGPSSRGGALLRLQGGGRARSRGRIARYRLQHRERQLRPDDVRRARGAVQGACRKDTAGFAGSPSSSPTRGAHAAVRRVPPDPVGIRRRHRGDPRQPRRASPVDTDEPAAPAAFRSDVWSAPPLRRGPRPGPFAPRCVAESAAPSICCHGRLSHYNLHDRSSGPTMPS